MGRTLNWLLRLLAPQKIRPKMGQREGFKVTFSDCSLKNTGYKGMSWERRI